MFLIVGQSKPFVQVGGNYYVQCVCGYLCKPSIRGCTWKVCLVHFGHLKGLCLHSLCLLKVLIPRYMGTVKAFENIFRDETEVSVEVCSHPMP